MVNVIDPRETKLMSLSEVAKQFGVTVQTVYEWTFNGCPSRNQHGNPMFYLKDVIAWQRTVTK